MLMMQEKYKNVPRLKLSEIGPVSLCAMPLICVGQSWGLTVEPHCTIAHTPKIILKMQVDISCVLCEP